MAESENPAARYRDRLEEIADALGIPTSWLHEGKTPPFAGEVFALIRFYAAITDAQSRQRVMNVAQREAERSQAADGPNPPEGSF